MIRKYRTFWRATALACTLAGCQNQVAPTAPEPTRLTPAKEEAAAGVASSPAPPSFPAEFGPVVPSQAVAPLQATQPAPGIDIPVTAEGTPTASDSPLLDVPDLEPEFVNPADLDPSRKVASHFEASSVPPGWVPGQPLPPIWAQGQPLPPGWAPGQPLPPTWSPPAPASWNQPGLPKMGGVGMPTGSWDDAPIPGSSIGIDNPAMWAGNPAGMSYGADPQLFGQLPPEIPSQLAQQTLYPIGFNHISAGFAPDVFRGLPGTYMGFAPGFSPSLLARCRYLYAGGVFIPFIYSGYRYVPVVFLSPRHRMFIYPSLIYVGGTLVPIYHSAPHLFAPFSQGFSVNVGSTFTSPLDLWQVPGPVMHRPIQLRKHGYRHTDHDLLGKVRFLKTYRPRIGLARHKVEVIRTKTKLRQRIRFR